MMLVFYYRRIPFTGKGALTISPFLVSSTGSANCSKERKLPLALILTPLQCMFLEMNIKYGLNSHHLGLNPAYKEGFPG
jgi:hypothetical protein